MASRALIACTNGPFAVWLSNEKTPSSWSLCTQACWGQSTGFHLKFHLCSRGRSTWELSCCLCSRLSEVLARWCQLHTLPLLSCLYHLGRYWCHYHYPRINGRSPVFESRSREKYFTADPEGETYKTDLCCVFSFHLPVRISSGVAAVLIWCKSNL